MDLHKSYSTNDIAVLHRLNCVFKSHIFLGHSVYNKRQSIYIRGTPTKCTVYHQATGRLI